MCSGGSLRILKLTLRPRGSGFSIIMLVVMLAVLIGFVSLAVDMGRVRLARAELQTVADAAARSGAFSLKDNTSPHHPPG
jgi:uncharacterized membrane protein